METSKPKRQPAFPVGLLALAVAAVLLALLWQFATRSPNSGAALAKAAWQGDVARARALLDAGADPNGVNMNSPWDNVLVAYYVHFQGGHSERPFRRPALCWAARYGHEEIVDLLLSHGANVRATDAIGANALQLAAGRGHSRIITRLLAHHAPIDARDDSRMTALMIAAGSNKFEAMRVLLAGGANVTAKDAEGKTALMWAASREDARIVRALLAHGANPNDSNGTMTALKKAAYRPANTALLRAAGARR